MQTKLMNYQKYLKVNNNNHSLKLTTIQASEKSDENKVYNNTRDKRKNSKQNSKRGDSLKTSTLRRRFQKVDATQWRYDIFTQKQKL